MVCFGAVGVGDCGWRLVRVVLAGPLLVKTKACTVSASVP